jgi:YfiH family protein
VIDAGLPVRAFFSAREGGISDAPYTSLNVGTHVGDDPGCVDLNRATVERHAGAPTVFLQAEHGARVHHVVDPSAPVPPADILVTDVPGIALAAIAADCVPLLMHDAITGAVAAAHIGRLGLWEGAVDATVAALLNLRTERAPTRELSASLGPSICGRCYEVPVELRYIVAERHPAATSSTRWGTPAIDIPQAVETRLAELGVGQIVRHRLCTFEETTYFSHRREGVTGRQCGVVVCGVSLP